MLANLPDDFLPTYWPLLVILLFLLVFIITLIILWRKGTLRELFTIGGITIRGNRRLRRLIKERDFVRKMREKAEFDLGSKVWEMSIEHPGYADTFQQLIEIEQNRDKIELDLADYEAAMLRATNIRNRTRTDFAYKLNLEYEKRKAASVRLNGIKAEVRDLQKMVKKTNRKLKRTQRSLESTQKKRYKIASKPSKGQEKRIALIDQELLARKDMINLLLERVSKLESRAAELPLLQDAIEKEMTSYDIRIAALQTERDETLPPLDDKANELVEKVRTTKELLIDMQEQMSPLLHQLGPVVQKERPIASILVTDLSRLDSLQARDEDLSNQIDLIRGQLEEIGVVKAQRFYILLLYILMAIMSVLILIRKF
jgi:chromosome segregation ATPase